MENTLKKNCSSKAHENEVANTFCQECRICMCNKCDNHHKELFQNHHKYNLDKDIEKIFTGFCKVENHLNKLEYFCQDHYQLCCGACISSIIGKGNGQHANCNICFIEDIKEEKKGKLEENIQYLESLSKQLDYSINQIRKIYEEMNEEKENIKIKIQNIFTKIRTELNEREDELLSEVDKKYEESHFSDELIKKSEKLPKNIEISLQVGREITKKWDEQDKLSLFINGCLDIEMNIKDINIINQNIEKAEIINTNIYFSTDGDDSNDIFSKIKNFGKIICQKKIDKNKEHEIIMKELREKEKNLEEKLKIKSLLKFKAKEKLQMEEKDILAINNELEQLENVKTEEEKRFLCKDCIDLIEKKKGFSFWISLFVQIYKNKELCPLLLEKFKEMNNKPKDNEKIMDRDKDLEQYIKIFGDISSEADNLIKSNNYDPIQFYGIILCYLNYYDHKNFMKISEKLFVENHEVLYEILLLYFSQFLKPINQNLDFLVKFIVYCISKKEFNIFENVLNYIRDVETFFIVIDKTKEKIVDR